MSTARAQVLAKVTDREQWLEDRRRGIGGSDAAAVAGLSPWRSPIRVWLEKTGQVGSEEAGEAGEAAYWGTVLQDVIAREFARRHGVKVRRRNAILQHPDHLFMIASIDREVIDPKEGRGLLEIKTTSAYNRDDWQDERIPDYVLIQVQHYLAVTGYPYAWVAVLIGGQHYQEQRIEPDAELIARLIALEREFWGYVERREMPPADGSLDCTEALRRLHPAEEPGKSIVLPHQLEEAARAYHDWAAVEKDAAYRKDQAANTLRQALGDAEVAYLPECERPICTYKSQTRHIILWDALCEAHPELRKIIEEFTEERVSRILRVNKF